MLYDIEKQQQEDFEDKVLNKITNHEDFSEQELKKMFDQLEEVDIVEGACGRWYQEISTIFKVKNKYIQLDWLRGLTEYQPNEFDNNPYEVIPEETTVVITKWMMK